MQSNRSLLNQRKPCYMIGMASGQGIHSVLQMAIGGLSFSLWQDVDLGRPGLELNGFGR